MTGRSAAAHVDEAGALEEHRCLLRQRGVRERAPRSRHQRRLHLLGRPRRMALEEQRRGAGDVRRGEARARGDDEGIAAELGQRRREDVRAGRRDVGLERMSERRQAARREARRDARPGRGHLEPVLRESNRHRAARRSSRGAKPGAVEVGDRAARALEDREPRIAGRGVRDDHADRPRGAGAIDLRLVRAPAPADERDGALQGSRRKRALAEEPIRSGDRSDVDQALIRLNPCLRNVVRGNERNPPEARGRDDRERRVEDVGVGRRTDGDRIGRGRGRAGRAEAEEVPVVPGGDDRHHACANDVGDGLDQRVRSGIGLRAAAREVDHVHPVLHRRLERLHDLGRRSRAAAAERQRHVEDPVVPDVGARGDAAHVGDRRMARADVLVAESRPARLDVGALHARDDAGHERPVERLLAVDRSSARPGAGKASRHDHLRRRSAARAFRKARRIREPGR